MSSLSPHCTHRENHKGKTARLPLGVITPAEFYGRIYLRCRCGEWWPSTPPVGDPALEELRCWRTNRSDATLATVRELVGADVKPEIHGELLALAALAPEAQLTIRCPQQKAIVNWWIGTSAGAVGLHNIEGSKYPPTVFRKAAGD